jgi:hypothetical protein
MFKSNYYFNNDCTFLIEIVTSWFLSISFFKSLVHRPNKMPQIVTRLACHSGGLQFESWSGHRISCLRVFVLYAVQTDECRIVPQIIPWYYLPCPLQSIIHLSCCYSTHVCCMMWDSTSPEFGPYVVHSDWFIICILKVWSSGMRCHIIVYVFVCLLPPLLSNGCCLQSHYLETAVVLIFLFA